MIRSTIYTIAATILLAAQGFAAPMAFQSSSSQANVNLGFNRGALAIGGSYESGAGDANWGGYLYHQTEKKDSGTVVVTQVTTFGAMLNMHVFKKTNVDVYVAPGFGLIMAEDAAGDSKTAFGPSMKIGAQYALNNKMRLGIERFLVTNWFDTDLSGSAEFTSAVMSFDF